MKPIPNKAFIDIRLRPGIITPLHASPYGPLQSNVTSSVKQEVHDVFQHCQSRTKPHPKGICTRIS